MSLALLTLNGRKSKAQKSTNASVNSRFPFVLIDLF